MVKESILPVIQGNIQGLVVLLESLLFKVIFRVQQYSLLFKIILRVSTNKYMVKESILPVIQGNIQGLELLLIIQGNTQGLAPRNIWSRRAYYWSFKVIFRVQNYSLLFKVILGFSTKEYMVKESILPVIQGNTQGLALLCIQGNTQGLVSLLIIQGNTYCLVLLCIIQGI